MAANDKVLCKALGVYFTLMAYRDCGNFYNLKARKKELAQVCNTSERTIYRHLELLVQKNLARYGDDKKDVLLLNSYRSVADHFGIIRLKYHYIDYEKIKDRLEYVLIGLVPEESKELQKRTFFEKLRRIPELYNLVKKVVTGRETSKFVTMQQIFSCQLETLTNPEQYTEEEIDQLRFLNADTNVGLSYLCAAYGYKGWREYFEKLEQQKLEKTNEEIIRPSKSGASYTKAVLIKKGIINAVERIYKAPNWTKEFQIGPCKYYPFWSRPQKARCFQLPDALSFNLYFAKL